MNEQHFKAKGFVRAANGEWYKPKPPRIGVGGLHPGQPEQGLRRALQQYHKTPEARPRRVVDGSGPVVRCTFIYCSGAGRQDFANRAQGFKQLQDAIAESLNLDDGDSTIEFEYEQIRTRGRRGTIVKMEMLA